MIRDITVKPLGKNTVYREGTVYCKLWDMDISVDLYDEDVTIEYAEKCAEAMNNMPEELVDAICRAAKLYCITFCDDVGEDFTDVMTVPIEEDTSPKEILKCIEPTGLVVDSPEDPSRIGYQLCCNCDWEEEHGMEIDILDDRLVFLSEYTGDSPWGDHSNEEWNYAWQI